MKNTGTEEFKITIPLQDGYRDEEAIKAAADHHLYMWRDGRWCALLDLDQKKVLRVEYDGPQYSGI